ncbi:cyclic-di-AMP receptor [Candidatus Phytoplasma meliae]|uniref:Cyclic-di-AMP receptor n=1 Tax=Candidatus Phytoplasma meliae TaxID=1848402 RepID=A0ABS5CYA3_9MOLU|nr:cyclic-di-AMP receptor [Candidatus Phytoplasma meliae]MBP5835946.1 cyclic-di-AMP receptor [Candidatus Phytoplasma meliae]
MKLIIAIVNSNDANKVQTVLIENSFFTTRLVTQGGFLKKANATFILGVREDQVSKVLDIIGKHSHKKTQMIPNNIMNQFSAYSSLPTEVSIGGATIFVLNVDQFCKV